MNALRDELGLSFAEMSARLGRNRRDATLSQISQALPNSGSGKPRQMGDDQARLIENKFDKPPGWMDRDPDFDAALAQLRAQPSTLLTAAEEPPRYARPRWPFARVSEPQVCSLAPHVLAALEAVMLGFLAGASAAAATPEKNTRAA